MDKVEYQKLNNSKIELHAYPTLCMFIFGLFQISSQHWFPLVGKLAPLSWKKHLMKLHGWWQYKEVGISLLDEEDGEFAN
jgi:hypothetical protein